MNDFFLVFRRVHHVHHTRMNTPQMVHAVQPTANLLIGGGDNE